MRSVFQELSERGFVEQVSDPDIGRWLAEETVTVYAGFDPTADSLHVGHLMAVMALARLQQAGHKVLVVVGGATGMVGDPSGKSEERNLLTTEQVAHNARAIHSQLEPFLDFAGENPAEMLNNHDWIGPMSFIDWLRDVGKSFTVNYMIAKESVKQRMGSEVGISFTEFSYMTMQAYDFLHLWRTKGCLLQAGGNDQWGNITAGIDLIRKNGGPQAYGITWPLLKTASGQKFGKTAGNSVWLDAERTSPYQFYQYWIRAEDADAERLLKIFTFLSLEEIAAIMGEHSAEPHRRAAQKRLAEEVTRLVHGEEGLAKAQRASEALFGGDLTGLEADELLEIFSDVPSSEVPAGRLAEGIAIADLLAETTLAKSKGQARRLIKQGGMYMNNQRVEDPEQAVTAEDLLSDAVLVLRAGKKRYHLVQKA